MLFVPLFLELRHLGETYCLRQIPLLVGVKIFPGAAGGKDVRPNRPRAPPSPLRTRLSIYYLPLPFSFSSPLASGIRYFPR
jgi:hypothetical protein